MKFKIAMLLMLLGQTLFAQRVFIKDSSKYFGVLKSNFVTLNDTTLFQYALYDQKEAPYPTVSTQLVWIDGNNKIFKQQHFNGLKDSSFFFNAIHQTNNQTMIGIGAIEKHFEVTEFDINLNIISSKRLVADTNLYERYCASWSDGSLLLVSTINSNFSSVYQIDCKNLEVLRQFRFNNIDTLIDILSMFYRNQDSSIFFGTISHPFDRDISRVYGGMVGKINANGLMSQFRILTPDFSVGDSFYTVNIPSLLPFDNGNLLVSSVSSLTYRNTNPFTTIKVPIVQQLNYNNFSLKDEQLMYASQYDRVSEEAENYSIILKNDTLWQLTTQLYLQRFKLQQLDKNLKQLACYYIPFPADDSLYYLSVHKFDVTEGKLIIVGRNNYFKLLAQPYFFKIALTHDLISGIRPDRFKNVPVTVYPNPAFDHLYVEGLDEGSDYEIYNQMGQLVTRGTLDEAAPVNVANLGVGLYHIRFVNCKGLFYSQFRK